MRKSREYEVTEGLVKLPKTAKCVITGQVKKIRRSYIYQMILRDFDGSLDKFEKGYVCREAKRMLKEGKSVDGIRAHFSSSQDLPDVPSCVLRAVKAPAKKLPVNVEYNNQVVRIPETGLQIKTTALGTDCQSVFFRADSAKRMLKVNDEQLFHLLHGVEVNGLVKSTY